ncbi:hypothetical protein [Sporomusa sp.]|jgi:hypothetical protein|uniref:hypothetical protein n=1 Tax=Sporomusa sp. TaxID=2078658 RepID=UPI002B990EF2|nr:hypothetical protein [Sporomusa sp.]MDF2876073.1 hypothetical protein [Sporomusa sp.]HWR07187.1 hypothetical protein [Sporomusa sp.]
MTKKDYNWVVGGLTLVLTLAVLFGGQLLWNKYAVANPINKTFQNIDGVESVHIGPLNEQGRTGEPIKIYVKLAHVPNLQKLYGEMAEGLKQVSGQKKYDIIIQDNRTPDLDKFYYSIHYTIQEAIFTGNFTEMAERIEAKASIAGVETQTYVDTNKVYLQMTKGTNEMYVVVARADSRQGVK